MKTRILLLLASALFFVGDVQAQKKRRRSFPSPPPPVYDSGTIANNHDKTFTKVEVEAEYPGGRTAWRDYLTSSPILARTRDRAAQMRGLRKGTYTVKVQFLIDKDGSVTNVEALTNHGFGLEEGVVEMIKASGHWKPAEQGGRLVKAYRTQPITFTFQ